MASMRPAYAIEEAVDPPAFGREERYGLGIAIAAHVILFAFLAFFDGSSTPITPPDRIAVTVSDDIALESISPNPTADPAPSVGEEIGDTRPPAEAVEVADATPAPAPRQTPAPTPRPSPTPRPQPKQAEQRPTQQPKKAEPREKQASQGSRIGSDFLSGTGGTGSDREQPAERAGPATAASLASAIARQLKPHWTAPQGVDTEKLVTVLAWQMNRDGSLRGRPTVVSQSGITDSNRAQADRHAELAIRAVQLAAPFDLPSEYYDSWNRVDAFRFDRRL